MSKRKTSFDSRLAKQKVAAVLTASLALFPAATQVQASGKPGTTLSDIIGLPQDTMTINLADAFGLASGSFTIMQSGGTTSGSIVATAQTVDDQLQLTLEHPGMTTFTVTPLDSMIPSQTFSVYVFNKSADQPIGISDIVGFLNQHTGSFARNSIQSFLSRITPAATPVSLITAKSPTAKLYYHLGNDMDYFNLRDYFNIDEMDNVTFTVDEPAETGGLRANIPPDHPDALELSGTPVGGETFTVHANGSFGDLGTDTASVAFKVIGNHFPHLQGASLNTGIIYGGAGDPSILKTFDLQNYFADADGDSLTYSFMPLSSGNSMLYTSSMIDNGIEATISGSTLSLTDRSFSGNSSYFYIVADDGKGGEASLVFYVDSNQKPVFDKNVTDTLYYTTNTPNFPKIGFDDPENEPLTVNVANSNTGDKNWFYTTDSNEVYFKPFSSGSTITTPSTFTISISDVHPGSTVSKTVTIMPNHAPAPAGDASKTLAFRSGQNTLSYDLSHDFTDEDHDTLVFTTNSSGATVSGSTLTVSHLYDGMSFNVDASDQKGGTASITYTLSLINSAPVAPANSTIYVSDNIDNVGVNSVTADVYLNDLIFSQFSDPDGDPLTFSYGITGNLGMTNSGDVLSLYRPYPNNDSDVTTTATDSHGATVTGTTYFKEKPFSQLNPTRYMAPGSKAVIPDLYNVYGSELSPSTHFTVTSSSPSVVTAAVYQDNGVDQLQLQAGGSAGSAVITLVGFDGVKGVVDQFAVQVAPANTSMLTLDIPNFFTENLLNSSSVTYSYISTPSFLVSSTLVSGDVVAVNAVSPLSGGSYTVTITGLYSGNGTSYDMIYTVPFTAPGLV